MGVIPNGIMNYILYLGPDDFRGLIDYPEEPTSGCNWVFLFVAHSSSDGQHAAPDIVNPEEIIRKLYETDNRINGPMSFDGWLRVVVQPGDIFDLPAGYEFRKETPQEKRYSICGNYCLDAGNSSVNVCPHNKCNRVKEVVLRIVKTELCPTCGTIDGKFCSNSFHLLKTEVKERTPIRFLT